MRPEDKPKRPWSGFTYLVLFTLAFLVALFLVWPLGDAVRNVFQQLVDAFRNR